MWIVIAISVVVTIFVVLIYANLTPSAPMVATAPGHLHDIRGPQFRRDISLLFGHMLLDGNRVDALHNGDEIFPAMLSAIHSAERSVNLETFVYWQGQIATDFAEALAERARAGVKVNVLLDWLGSQQMRPELIDLMEEAGVVVKRFRPLSWYSLDRFNNRTHRKLLIVDGKTGFTGGVGIAQEWTGNAEDEDHIRDDHYRVEGPVVGQMQAAFMDNWQKAEGQLLHGEDYFPKLAPAGNLTAHSVTSSPGAGGESARSMYLLAVTAAQQSIDIGAAYFVPDDLLVEALVKASERGVQIRIQTAGEQSDSDITRHASRGKWGPLLQAGIEIYEYQPTLYHTKLMVIDRHWTMVGSTNFDARSFRLNDENNLNVLDSGFAEQQIKVFEQDLLQSKKYTYERWENRPWTHKLIEPFALMMQSQL